MTTRIQISGKSGEGCAGYFYAEPRSCGNADSGVPEIILTYLGQRYEPIGILR